MEIVASFEVSIDSFRDGKPTIDVRFLTELMTLLEVLGTWKEHPGWSDFVRGLVNEYSHTVATLAAAKVLKDMGHSVTLQESKAVGRAADLLLVVGAQQYAVVEVKAPGQLRWRGSNLSQEDAKTIVEAAIKRAGTGKKGQLSPENPGILVIVGFHLSSDDLRRLEEACSGHFSQHRSVGRHPHIMAIMPLSLGATIKTYSGPFRDLQGHVVVRVVANPGYRGQIEFDAKTWAE